MRRRLAKSGRNEITVVKGKSLLLKLLGQFTHFLAIVLWLAAFFSFLSEYLKPGEGMLTLGIAIVVVIVINAVFTFIQEYRAEKALEALNKLLPFNVKVIRCGKESEVAAEEIVSGDLICCEATLTVTLLPCDDGRMLLRKVAETDTTATMAVQSRCMESHNCDLTIICCEYICL